MLPGKNGMQGARVLLFACASWLILNTSFAESTFSNKCILVPSECQKYGYEISRFPNFNGNTESDSARNAMWTYEKLYLDSTPECYSEIKMLLCLAYFPLCLDSNQEPAGPCQTFCEAATEKCNVLKHGFGHPLAAGLTCRSLSPAGTESKPCVNSTGDVPRLLHKYSYTVMESTTTKTTTVEATTAPSTAEAAGSVSGDGKPTSGTARTSTETMSIFVTLAISVKLLASVFCF